MTLYRVQQHVLNAHCFMLLNARNQSQKEIHETFKKRNCTYYFLLLSLQCFDTVGLATGRASSL